MTSVDSAEVMRALTIVHREELAELTMQIAVYRALLEEHGITPPDLAGSDFLQMWRDCSKVIDVAYEFIGKLGSAKEFLSETAFR